MNKVLFYHLEFPAGGTEKVTINIAKFLSNKNYEIHVMTSNKTQDKNFPYILKSATPFPKCYLHKEKWTFDS